MMAWAYDEGMELDKTQREAAKGQQVNKLGS
jgi:hypothetical protein